MVNMPCQWSEGKLGGERKKTRNTININAQRDVDISRQARLAVQQDRLAADNHVGNSGAVECGGQPFKQLCEH
ncbi:hypothetical protein W02_37120 [Nitrospira sp. KM1]|nr:hypothetical protein W02_37120 [Nitrospira sp. KM1]